MESGWRATWKSVVGEGWSRGCRCCCALGQTANPGSISPIAMTSRPTHSRDATLAHPRSNHPPPQSRSSAAPQLQRPSHPTFPFSASASPSLSLCVSLLLSRTLYASLSLCVSLFLSRALYASLSLVLSVSFSFSRALYASLSLFLFLSLPRALYESLSLVLSLPRALYVSLSLSLPLVLYTCLSLSSSCFIRGCVSLCRSTGLLDGRPWSY